VKLPFVIATVLLAALAAGCGTADRPPAPPPVVARVFIEARPQEQAVRVVLPVSHAHIEVDPRPVLLEFDLAQVELVTAEFGRALLLHWSGAAARDLYQKTIGSQGRRLVLTLDGAPVSVFTIDGPVSNGLLTFYLELPDDQLPPLARNLQQTVVAIQGRLARQK